MVNDADATWTAPRRARLPQGAPPTRRREHTASRRSSGKTITGSGWARTSPAQRHHQMKKLALNDLKQLRESMRIRSPNSSREGPYRPPYYHPRREDRPQYMRRAAGGAGRGADVAAGHGQDVCAGEKVYDLLRKGPAKQEVATTMAFVGCSASWSRPRRWGTVRPNQPEEARIGMDSLSGLRRATTPRPEYSPWSGADALPRVEQPLRHGGSPRPARWARSPRGTSYATTANR